MRTSLSSWSTVALAVSFVACGVGQVPSSSSPTGKAEGVFGSGVSRKIVIETLRLDNLAPEEDEVGICVVYNNHGYNCSTGPSGVCTHGPTYGGDQHRLGSMSARGAARCVAISRSSLPSPAVALTANYPLDQIVDFGLVALIYAKASGSSDAPLTGRCPFVYHPGREGGEIRGGKPYPLPLTRYIASHADPLPDDAKLAVGGCSSHRPGGFFSQDGDPPMTLRLD